METKQLIRNFIANRKKEAAQKQIFNKIALILKIKGQPVIFTTHKSINKKIDKNGVITVGDDDEWYEFEESHYFQGYKYGYNLEIHGNYIEKTLMDVTLFWNGRQVFSETSGDISCYVPMNDWENAIDYLYVCFSRIEKHRKKNEETELKSVKEKNAKSILRLLSDLWGYK